MIRLVTRLWADDRGGEVLEYTIVTGLVVLAVIGAAQSVGGKVLARWTSLRNSL